MSPDDEQVHIFVEQSMDAELRPSGHTEVPAWQVTFQVGDDAYSLCVPFDEFEHEFDDWIYLSEARVMYEGYANGPKCYVI